MAITQKILYQRIAMPAIENNMGSGFQWIYSNAIIYNDVC